MKLEYLVIHCTATPEGREITKKDIEQWHIEVVQTRMKETKTTANDVVKMISIIYSWAIKKKKIKAMQNLNQKQKIMIISSQIDMFQQK